MVACDDWTIAVIIAPERIEDIVPPVNLVSVSLRVSPARDLSPSVMSSIPRIKRPMPPMTAEVIEISEFVEIENRTVSPMLAYGQKSSD